MNTQKPQLAPSAFVKTLPGKPGVYQMLDSGGQVLYVGKARNLRRRVASYFREPSQLEDKTRALMRNMHDVQITVTHTETEALLLENNLIKEFRPRYNIVLRDDKSFPYIYLTTQESYPRLAFHRGARSGAGRYFGPYPSAGSVRETLNLLQKLFRIRQCSDSFFRNRSRPCLQYQIKRCTAPCVDLVDTETYADNVRHAVMFLEGKSEEMIAELVTRMSGAAEKLEYELAARYRDQITKVRRVQEKQYISGAKGNIDVIAACAKDGVAVVQVFYIRDGQNLGSKSYVPTHVQKENECQVLEAFLPQYYLSGPSDRQIPAEVLVNQPLEDMEPLMQVLSDRAKRRVVIHHRVRGERARWVEMAERNAELVLGQRLTDRSNLAARFEALSEVLELDEPPTRIECFDISHTQGEATVASCVVFDADGAVKSNYRRFNIKDVAAGDDYGAMRQALQRRYTRMRREEAKLPDLLLVDGGKGQLSVASEVLEELQINETSVASVAKGTSRKPGLETVYVHGRELPIVLEATSSALHLIQQVRDEAHRFAVTGHRRRRQRARTTSALEDIPGVGARRRQRLLLEFGGLQGVARAGVEDLCRVKGISRGLAQMIYESFRDE